MAFCSYFKIQPVAGGADRIKKSEWKLVSHDNSQPPPRAGTAAFYRSRLLHPPPSSPLSLRLFRVHLCLPLALSVFLPSLSPCPSVQRRPVFRPLSPAARTATARFPTNLPLARPPLVSLKPPPRGSPSSTALKYVRCTAARNIDAFIYIQIVLYTHIYARSQERTRACDLRALFPREGADRISRLFPWRSLIGPLLAATSVSPVPLFPLRTLHRGPGGGRLWTRQDGFLWFFIGFLLLNTYFASFPF